MDGGFESGRFRASDGTRIAWYEGGREDGPPIKRDTGEEVERIIAKMSKTLKNVVNPDDVIAEIIVSRQRDRSTRPGRAPVIMAFSNTASPATKTWCAPSAY